MGRKKIEVKYIEDSTTRQVTFAKRRPGIFKKADALARLCNVEVGVLINSPGGRPYTYGSPSFNEVVKRFENPYPISVRSPDLSLARQTRILEKQAELDCLMQEIERNKEREKVLKQRKEENLKKIADLNLEGCVAFKEQLEALRDTITKKRVEMEASPSLSMLSKNKNEKKKM